MYFQQDYILRMIQMLSQMLARLFFGKDAHSLAILEETGQGREDPLHQQLLTLLAQGAYNAAENLLFERLEAGNVQHLAIAMDFYERLNALDDQALAAGNFTREEIYAGLQEIAQRFGIAL